MTNKATSFKSGRKRECIFCHHRMYITVSRYSLTVQVLPPTQEEVNAFARVRLSVCSQVYSKTRAWIWIRHGHGLGSSIGWVGSEIFAYENGLGWV